jgi:hypothetical protein
MRFLSFCLTLSLLVLSTQWTVAQEKDGATADKKAAEGNRPARKASDLRKEFERLLPLWEKEWKEDILVAASSSTYDYWKGKHGQAIIKLGPAIIPDLIQQVKMGNFFFNVPLEVLTKIDIANGDIMSEQEKSKLWVEWWEAKQK